MSSRKQGAGSGVCLLSSSVNGNRYFFETTIFSLIPFYLYLHAALAVLLDFLLQVTAFVSLIVFDIMRAEDNRVDCFPCIKVSSSSEEDDEGIRIFFISLFFWFASSIFFKK